MREWPAEQRYRALEQCRCAFTNVSQYINPTKFLWRQLFPGIQAADGTPLKTDPPKKTTQKKWVTVKNYDGDRTLLCIGEEEESDYVILYFHGNAEYAAKKCDFFGRLARHLKAIVVAVEYPGYNKEPGNRTPEEITDVAVNALVKTKELYPHKKFIVMGFSIGTGPTAVLASEVDNIHACILHAPYRSLPEIVMTFIDYEMSRIVELGFQKSVADSMAARVLSGAVLRLPKHVWATRDNATRFKCPLLVLHAEHDEIVPYAHGSDVYDAAKNAANEEEDVKIHTQEAGVMHNVETHEEEKNIFIPVADFLKSIKKRQKKRQKR